nr:hypothetical protein [Tanacetum cinerariifolium]
MLSSLKLTQTILTFSLAILTAIQKQYDQQYDAFKKSHLKIIAYQVVLESVEARIVVHQKNEAVYEEDIALLNLDVQLRDTSLVTLRQKLKKAEQERDDLKLKLEKFETSSNNLAKLIGSQLDANNKTGLGYGNHVNGCEANDSKSVSDEEDSPVNYRFMKSNRNHAVPPPYTGNYMPPRANFSFAGLDDSVYKCKGTGQRETRPVWNNTGRVNHQNKLTHPHPKRNFVPAATLIKSGQVPVNTAKQSCHKAAASVSAARRVNTAAPRPNVNSTRPTTTQDLVIIKLIRRVKRLERELKVRTPPTKV